MFIFEIVYEDAQGRSSNCHGLVEYSLEYVLQPNLNKKITMRTKPTLQFQLQTSAIIMLRNDAPN